MFSDSMPSTHYVGKCHSVLSLYDLLLWGQQVLKPDFCEKYAISERTFDRDIAEIRRFLRDERNDLKLEYLPLAGRYSVKAIR